MVAHTANTRSDEELRARERDHFLGTLIRPEPGLAGSHDRTALGLIPFIWNTIVEL
jgi:hypothetical protein